MIVPAAGAGRRWRAGGGHGRKHTAEIGGVPILERLIWQCQSYGHRPVVLCHPQHPYSFPGADYETVVPGRWRNDAGKLAETHPWWSARTLILFGDVYLTDAAAAAVFAPRAEWTMYGRLSRYRHGPKRRSQFALSFGPGEHAMVWRHIRAVHDIPTALNAGGHGGLRKFYQSATGQTAGPKPTRDLGHLVTIDDASDDVDKPAHLAMISRAVARGDA